MASSGDCSDAEHRHILSAVINQIANNAHKLVQPGDGVTHL